jgi:hypothetical protein
MYNIQKPSDSEKYCKLLLLVWYILSYLRQEHRHKCLECNRTRFLVYRLRTIHCCPPLLCSGQSSWLQIQRPEFDSRSYEIFWEVVGLERSPLSLVSKIEKLLGRKNSGSGLEIREYGRRDLSRWPRGILFPQKLALTLPICGGRSVV